MNNYISFKQWIDFRPTLRKAILDTDVNVLRYISPDLRKTQLDNDVSDKQEKWIIESSKPILEKHLLSDCYLAPDLDNDRVYMYVKSKQGNTHDYDFGFDIAEELQNLCRLDFIRSDTKEGVKVI